MTREERQKNRAIHIRQNRQTHSALEGIDLTGVGLDLVSELHALQLGLFESLVVLAHCLVKV